MSASELNSAAASSVAPSCCPEPADWGAALAPPPPAALGVRLTIWHQRPGRPPEQAKAPVFQVGRPDRPLRVDELTAGPEWALASDSPGAVVVACEPITWQRQPERAEREAAAALRLEVGIGRGALGEADIVAKVCDLPPGASQPFLHPAGPVMVRCLGGSLRVTVTSVS